MTDRELLIRNLRGDPMRIMAAESGVSVERVRQRIEREKRRVRGALWDIQIASDGVLMPCRAESQALLDGLWITERLEDHWTGGHVCLADGARLVRFGR